MHTHSPEQLRKGYISALIVVVIWTGFIVTSRMAGKSPLTPYDTIALRYAVAAFAIFPFWLKYRTKLFEWRKIVLSLTGAIAFTLLAFNGFHRTPASHAGILLQGFLPFAVGIMAYFFAGERPSRQRLFGLALIAIGVASMALESFAGGSITLLGDGFMLAASLTWALYTTLLRRWNIPPMDSAIAVTILAAIMYLPVYVLFLPKNLAETPWQTCAFHALYQGVIVAVVQMIFYTRAVSQLGATRLAMMTSTVPLLASLVASIMPQLNEPLTTPIIIGLIFVVLGAYAGNRQPKATPQLAAH